jgi:glycosyltransferase involved in cell wall biosynthesis
MTSTSYPKTEDDWKGHFIRDMVYSISKNNNIKLRLWAPPGMVPANVKHVSNQEENIELTKIMDMGGIAHILRIKSFRRIIISMKLLMMLRSAYIRNKDVDILHVNWLQNALPAYGTRTSILICVLGTDYRLLQIPTMSVLLRNVIKRRRCIIAPNAEWMARGLKDRFGDIAEIRIIPFGVDEKLFLNQRSIQTNKRVWIVVSRITTKKIGHLFNWGNNLFNDKDELHLIGPNQEDLNLPKWIRYHGPIDSESLRTDWYTRVMGLITLSEHDEGRPQVVIEAMAAGLPIIASNIPAHNTTISHMNTGCIVSTKPEFDHALRTLSDEAINRALGEEARKWVKKNIGTWDDCARRYLDAYDFLLKKT